MRRGGDTLSTAASRSIIKAIDTSCLWNTCLMSWLKANSESGLSLWVTSRLYLSNRQMRLLAIVFPRRKQDGSI